MEPRNSKTTQEAFEDLHKAVRELKREIVYAVKRDLQRIRELWN